MLKVNERPLKMIDHLADRYPLNDWLKQSAGLVCYICCLHTNKQQRLVARLKYFVRLAAIGVAYLT